jgi:hypothetical protein
MRSIDLTDLSVPLLRHIRQSPGQPVEIRMEGQRLGTLTFESAADEPAIDLSRSPRLQQILDEARKDYKKQGGVSLQEVKERLAHAEVASDE